MFVSVIVISLIQNPVILGLSFLYQHYPKKELILPRKYMDEKTSTTIQLLFGHSECIKIVDTEPESLNSDLIVKIHGSSIMLPAHLSTLVEFYERNPDCKWTYNTRKIVHKKYWFKPSLLKKQKNDFLEDVDLTAFGIDDPYIILKTLRNEVYRDPNQVSHRRGIVPGNIGFGNGHEIESPTIVAFS